MNLKDFKPVSQDKECYTIAHPNGKHLRIEKAGLHRGAHSVIKHLFGGGFSTDDVSALGGGDPMASFTAADNLEKEADKGAQAPFSVAQAREEAESPDVSNGFTRQGPLVSAQDQAAMDAIKAKEGAVSGDDSTQGASRSQVQKALQQRGPDSDPLLEQKSGMDKLLQQQIQQQQEALNAGQSAGKDVANIQQGEADALSGLPTPNDIFAKYQASDAKLQQSVAEGKVDPQHFVHSMGTGSKILTGLGMVLSGMGSATAGQPNYALGVVNDAITRDVDAQKNDQSRKMNLWKMNRELMGSDMAANLATQNQIKAGVVAKLQAAQTKAQLPQEKLRAQMAIDSLQQEMLQNNMRRGLLMQGTQGGAGGSGRSTADPAMLVPEMVKDPAQQKGVFEEIRNRQNVARNGSKIISLVKQGIEQLRDPKTAAMAAAGYQPPAIVELDSLITPNISALDGTVKDSAKISAEEALHPKVTDLLGNRSQARINSAYNWLQSQKSSPISKGNYIDLDRYESTALPDQTTMERQHQSGAQPKAALTPQNKVFLDWARKNPGNPKAKAVLRQFGVK